MFRKSIRSSYEYFKGLNKKDSKIPVSRLASAFFYIGIALSLFYIDHILGNGMINAFTYFFCKCFCFFRSKFIEEALKNPPIQEPPANLRVFLVEIFALCLTMTILQKYKSYRRADRLDDLMQESKQVLRQTAEFLEKWRDRRIPTGIEQGYLDEIPSELKPLELEVPILHMAIVDSLFTSRTTHSERGDAGDSMNITDSAVLSVTSLLDDDDSSISEVSPGIDYGYDKPTEYVPETSNRLLWSVTEED